MDSFSNDDGTAVFQINRGNSAQFGGRFEAGRSGVGQKAPRAVASSPDCVPFQAAFARFAKANRKLALSVRQLVNSYLMFIGSNRSNFRGCCEPRVVRGHLPVERLNGDQRSFGAQLHDCASTSSLHHNCASPILYVLRSRAARLFIC
jgi:hypothetical protein